LQASATLPHAPAATGVPAFKPVSRAASSFTTPVNSVPSNVFGIHTRGISSADKEQAEERAQKVNALFNAATLPFYWARFEPQRGSPSPRRSKTLPAGASTITWSQKDTPRRRLAP